MTGIIVGAARLAARVAAAFAVAFTIGTLCPQLARASAVPVHTEWHACHLAVLYSRGEAPRSAVLSAAAHADPELRREITHYVDTGTEAAFWAVMSDCGYGL